MNEISIIVPVYNVEKYLSKCIDSILNQTFINFELILVNDGSSDKSPVICEEYKKLDDRIKVIHKSNGGLSSARNIGIKQSKGNFIAFIDSDDYIHPQMFEILYNNMKINDSDLVLCDYKKVYENESDKYKNYDVENIKSNNYTNIEALSRLQGNKGITYVVAWNKLYKRRLFNDLKYKEGKIHEDEFIIHEILYKCNLVSYVSMELYYYLQRSDSITTSKFNISRLDGLDACIERILFYKHINEKELMYKAEIIYIEKFLEFYYKLENEVENPTKHLRRIKNKFRRRIIGFMKNHYLKYKEKIALIGFCINPFIYEKYKEIKDGGL